MNLVSVINESKNRKWGLSVKFSADSLKKIKVCNFSTRTRPTTVLGYPLELDNESLLLRTPHTKVIEHGKIKLVQNWVLHPIA